ncbi:MAG: tetratricopeptide repeat protein [Candidatus Sericytochromatia bacterium]
MFGKMLKKGLPDNNPLSALNDIKKVQKKIEERDDNKNIKFEEFFLTGVLHLKEFLKTNNKFNLKRSIHYLVQATTIKKNHAGTFFYLSFIAYLTGDIKLAEKYYYFTLAIDKDYPNLDDLKNKLFSK